MPVTRKQRMDLVNAAQQGLAQQGLMYRVQPGENRTRLFEGRDIATGQVCRAYRGEGKRGGGEQGVCGNRWGVRAAACTLREGRKRGLGGGLAAVATWRKIAPALTKKKREKGALSLARCVRVWAARRPLWGKRGGR